MSPQAASSKACVQHPTVTAAYRCERCASLLCEECIDEGHAIFFCKLCGERAMPVDSAKPATTQERRRKTAIEKPYSLKEALLYPFRGLGVYLYIAAVVTLAFLGFLLRHGFGCYKFLLYFGFWSMLIGIQFKIIRSTAQGDDELPDWPDYSDFIERFLDVLVYLFIAALNFLPALAFTAVFGFGNIFTTEPSFFFWAGFSILLWVGSALSLMAFGAAGVYGGLYAIRVDLHYLAFRRAGAEAITVTNLMYVLGIIMWVVPAVLQYIPFLGLVVNGIFTAYWSFVGPHLVGVLFRRHANAVNELYA